MRSPIVRRSTLDLARVERDQWHRRAESALQNAPRPAAGSGRRHRRVLVLALLGTLVLVAGAAGSEPRGTQRPEAVADYSSCIGIARYQHPIEGNQYQELVNALYACGIYGTP